MDGIGRTRFLLAALLSVALGVGAALAVGACGDDDDDDGATTPVEESETVELRLTEFDIDPDEVRVRAGVIEFVVRNDGDEDHALAVETTEGEVEQTDPVAPGETARVKVDLEPGQYAMYDPTADYRERGMEGVVEVESRVRTETETETDTEEETETETEPETDTETETETEARTETETETETQPTP